MSITSLFTGPYAMLVKAALGVALVAAVGFGIWFNFHYISEQKAAIADYKAQKITLVAANKSLGDSINVANKAVLDGKARLAALQGNIDASKGTIANLDALNKKLTDKLAASPIPADNSKCQAQVDWMRDQAILLSENLPW